MPNYMTFTYLFIDLVGYMALNWHQQTAML